MRGEALGTFLTSEKSQEGHPRLAKVHSRRKDQNPKSSVASIDTYKSINLCPHHHNQVIPKHTVIEEFAQRPALFRSPPNLGISRDPNTESKNKTYACMPSTASKV